MFIGEVLSDFHLLLWPFATCVCIICLGIALFGHKFLIIQKKNNQQMCQRQASSLPWEMCLKLVFFSILLSAFPC